MEVILKEDIAKLGARGDVVKVAEGYGRNYLLPRKLAIVANEGNKAVIVQMKAASVRKSAKEKRAGGRTRQTPGRRVKAVVSAALPASTISSLARSPRAIWATLWAKKGFNVDRRKDPVARTAENRGRVHRVP